MLEQELSSLGKQHAILTRLAMQARERHQRTKDDLAAGLLTAVDLMRSEAELKQRELELQSSEVARMQARELLETVRNRSTAFEGATRESVVDRYAVTRTSSPDLLRFDEPAIRLELELARLQAERRSAEARQRAVRDSLEAMDVLLTEVRTRPLYRAMTADTELAFVPYAGLAQVQVGNAVYRCALAVFGCTRVGWVREIVPGEVVTQDPWGELARGQYVVLSVEDRAALHENVLRVRPGEVKREPAEGLAQVGE